MDLLEDEMEVHAYEDLVPLEVKLALEENVFGWTHLTSSVLGHTAFTLGAYWLVYQGVTWLDQVLGFMNYATRNPAYLDFLRISLALWAAINTYRMVRRRRQVWFRAAYGSKAYKQDEARRRQMVQETDRTTALGRAISNLRERRVNRKLLKAESLFAKKHARSVAQQHAQKEQEMAVITHQASSSTTWSDGSFSSSSTEDDSSDDDAHSPPSFMPMKRRPSFHIEPTKHMQSVAHDQILFESIVHMPYAHGGFFGAAPFLLANPHWISILRHLMPDVYVEISRRIASSPAPRLIHWAENNPVVAAYGAAHELDTHSHIPNIEWDVFLDPYLVHRVEVVLREKEKYLAAQDAKLPSSLHILAFYEKELKRRSQALVDKMLIAHGKLNHLIMEQTGVMKHFNYSRVKRTRRTLGGGIYARQWMAVFAESLKLGVHYEDVTKTAMPPLAEATPTTPTQATNTTTSKGRKTTSLLALAESKCPDMSISESIKLVQSISKCEHPIGLVLDVKSRHIPQKVWSVVIDTLREAGVRVEGIASFAAQDIRKVSLLCATPVKEIFFFHSAGDLQRACHEGRIQRGDRVFFNSGSLLWESGQRRSLGNITNFDPEDVKQSYRIRPLGLRSSNSVGSTIEMYKQHYNLSIGLYCQEFAVDEAAVNVVAKLVNENSDIYDLGFSWGGVNGITIKGISPGRFTATDGFWNQRYIGEPWNYNLVPV
jgi:hypothetical protein